MKKSWVLYIICLLMFSSLAVANTEYDEIGNADAYYQQGTGFFNNVEMPSSDYYEISSPVLLDEQHNTPLVSDLDGDGVNEIIVLDDDTYRLYTPVDLNAISSYALSDDGHHSNIVIYDIDDDGLKELIISLEDTSPSGGQLIEIAQWNGTAFSGYTIDWSSLQGAGNGETAIKCWNTETCGMIYSEIRAYYDGDTEWGVVVFNSTDFENPMMFSSLSKWYVPCFPRQRSFPIIDMDEDGKLEWVFNMFVAYLATAQEEFFWTYWLEYDETNRNFTIDESEGYQVESFIGGQADCSEYDAQSINGYIGNFITPPLVFDFKAGGGLETVFGAMVDEGEFFIISYEGCSGDCSGSDIDILDDYPETCEGFFGIGQCPNADYLSNALRVDIFDGDEGYDDVCVVGFMEDYDRDDETGMQAWCGSESSTWFGQESLSFEPFEVPYNLSVKTNADYYKLNNIVHTAQHSETYEPEELVTSYGVFGLVRGTLYHNMYQIFENPKEDAVVLSIDADGIGREDLVVLQNQNLWYIDDLYSNSEGYISYWYVDPCLDATWKINTSLEVRASVNNVRGSEDAEDKVQSRVILYYGTANEQDTGWSANVSAGTVVTFASLSVNQTIATGTLRIMGRDVENPTEIDIVDLTYSVGLAGVVFGDCNSEGIPVPPEPPTPVIIECDNDEDCNSGYLCINQTCVERGETLPVIGMQEASGIFNIPVTALWLMFMLALAIGFWFAPMGRGESFFDSGYARLGAIIIGELFMLILGTYFGFLPLAIIVSIVVIALIAVGVWGYKKVAGVSG